MIIEPDFSYLFHQSSKSADKGHAPIPLDENAWPIEWRTIYYKGYMRLPKIPLSEEKVPADLCQVITQRQSARQFSSEACSLEELAILLKYGLGNLRLSDNGKSMKRAQPSGGARYPIEVYPLVLRGKGELKPGLYHYNVKQHALDVLWDKQFSPEEIDALFTYDWVKDASVVFLMTAVFRRNQAKYGERGYRYILVEAGHIGQNILLLAEALGLKSCPLGGTRDEKIEKLLDIDGVHESLVYAVAVGK